VTFRVAALWVHRWLGLGDNDPVADGIDTVAAWGCWALPLLLAEPLIQLRSICRSRMTASRRSLKTRERPVLAVMKSSP